MMRKRVVASVLVASAALAIAAPAEASVTIVDYSFSGSFFGNPVSGTMALNSDSSHTFPSQYTLNSLNLALGSSTFTQSNSTLTYSSGYVLSGSGGTGTPTSFQLPFDPSQASQNVSGFIVTQVGGVGAVPEPASWAMMLLGFGAIGLAIGRRKTPEAMAAQQKAFTA